MTKFSDVEVLCNVILSEVMREDDNIDFSRKELHPENWSHILWAMRSIGSKSLNAHEEKILLRIMMLKQRLHLQEPFDCPSAMSPEDMLKSFAVQVLGKWTGAKYLTEMKKLRAELHNGSLSSVIDTVIEKVYASYHNGNELVC